MLAKVQNDRQAELGAGNPVNFPSTAFNEGMHYTNGVFLIFDPGYHHVIVNLRSPSIDSTLEADIMVNFEHGYGFAERVGGGSLNLLSIVKLELYDSINVRIRAGIATKHADASNFQIQKINFNNY